MTELKQSISEIVPGMYEAVADALNMPPTVNVAGTNQCHVLTNGLHQALKNRGIESRRELHKTSDGLWHYVIAHTPEHAEPSDDDIITDLNPWQYMQRAPLSLTFLHDSRQAVMERLEQEGAPDYFISLRALSTVAKAHTIDLMP